MQTASLQKETPTVLLTQNKSVGTPTHNPLQLKKELQLNPLREATGTQNPLLQLKKTVAVNYHQELEKEADTMGAEANKANDIVQKPATPISNTKSASIEVIQCKSTVVNNANLGSKDTPLTTLHKTFAKYFQKAAVPEVYVFHTTQVPYNGNTYKNNYLKAGKVVANIDPTSSSKTDGSNRNNSIIQPYGHLGVMERAIFDRTNIGNIYDGGHLVEHTLMEGQDADVEGNIAPQQNKYFNQGLMRGWESIAENYMHHYGVNFQYTVEVGYDQPTYNRTGKQVREAGVLGAVHSVLPPTEQTQLDAETVTFERWVPSQWRANVTNPTGGNLPQLTLNKGAHWNAVAPTQAAAEGMVFTPQPSPHTGLLRRTNSGMLGGFIETAQAPIGLPGTVTVGNQPSFSAHMFQPIPQDKQDQPAYTNNAGAYGGQMPSALPAYTMSYDSFSKKVDFSKMVEDIHAENIKTATTASKFKRKKPKAATVLTKLDGIGKKHSKGYNRVRDKYFKNAQEGGAFLKILLDHRVALNRTLTKTDLIPILQQTSKHSAFSRKNRRFKLLKLPYEKKLK